MNTFGILVVALVAVVLGLWAVWPSRHDSEVYTHIYSFFYRTLMRVAHHFHWHRTRTIHPENDIFEVCDWCGLSWVKFRGGSRAQSKMLSEMDEVIAQRRRERASADAMADYLCRQIESELAAKDAGPGCRPEDPATDEEADEEEPEPKK